MFKGLNWCSSSIAKRWTRLVSVWFLKNNVWVCWMFEKMVFDPSLHKHKNQMGGGKPTPKPLTDAWMNKRQSQFYIWIDRRENSIKYSSSIIINCKHVQIIIILIQWIGMKKGFWWTIPQATLWCSTFILPYRIIPLPPIRIFDTTTF